MSLEWIYRYVFKTPLLRIAVLKRKFRHLGRPLIEVQWRVHRNGWKGRQFIGGDGE